MHRDVMARDLAESNLDVLQTRYPGEWQRVSGELLGALERGKTTEVSRWLATVKADASQWRRRLSRSAKNPRVFDAAFPHLLREHLATLALKRTSTALAAQQSHGRARLGWWSGTLIQRLLFTHGLERKPASLRWVRFWWPLVFDRKLLMPLVQPRGIYCFYSRELIAGLQQLIGGRACLEVAAGDGTLTRFLKDAGVDCHATDDASWSHVVNVPASVERLEARAALQRHQPKVVVCSWAPPDNRFERAIFEQPSVELYIAIGSRHAHAAHNRDAWEWQTTFDVTLDEALSATLLPPELDGAVHVFRRR